MSTLTSKGNKPRRKRLEHVVDEMLGDRYKHYKYSRRNYFSVLNINTAKLKPEQIDRLVNILNIRKEFNFDNKVAFMRHINWKDTSGKTLCSSNCPICTLRHAEYIVRERVSLAKKEIRNLENLFYVFLETDEDKKKNAMELKWNGSDLHQDLLVANLNHGKRERIQRVYSYLSGKIEDWQNEIKLLRNKRAELHYMLRM